MHEPTYQTVRLTKGKHSSPQHGVCVMELASMLAGEPFTDQPSSVSRSLAAFLRMYNDTVDDRRRQDLYAYASTAVGTASGERAERDRVERLDAWAEEMWERRPHRALLRRVTRRWTRNRHIDPESAARGAIKAIGRITDARHARVLALVDELIEIGARNDRLLEALGLRAPRVRSSAGEGLRMRAAG
jgi:hypothetical protein